MGFPLWIGFFENKQWNLMIEFQTNYPQTNEALGE